MQHRAYVNVFSLGLSFLLLGCAPSPVDSSPVPSSPTPESSAIDDLSKQLRPQPERGQYLPISAQAQIKGQLIQLEVATTPQQQSRGLMYRAALPDDRGMLFPFSPARPVQFWMRSVPVNLDMVFLREGRVEAIADSVPPCRRIDCPTYGPSTAVDNVIELRAGRAQELGLQVGDRVEIEFIEPIPNPQPVPSP
ncbi:MAG TPA: DUF192 domain-containing protein [Chroococcidiopsis sp.]